MPQGQPTTIPDDGLTTRERRNQAVTALHIGENKGKSTAAFGTALRAWNAGLDIAVFQFVKSPKWRVGEEDAFAALAQVHRDTGAGSPVQWHKMGAGWSWSRRQGDESDHAQAAADGWAEVSRRLSEQAHDLYILDEFTYPMMWGWVDPVEVAHVLRDRPGKQHVFITGREAPPEVLDVATLVTHMTKVKHPMDAGQKGQKGIEW